MTKESSDTGIEDAKQIALDEIRTLLANRLIVLLGWSALPLTVIYVYRIISGSLPASFYLAALILLSYIAVALYREKLSLQIKITLLLLPPFALSGVTLAFQGLYSQGALLLALGILLCFFFKPVLTNIKVLAGCVVILIWVTYAHTTGAYETPLNLDGPYLAASRLSTTLILLIAIGVVAHYLIKSVAGKTSQLLQLQNDHELKIEELATAIEEINLLRRVVNVCAKCQKVNMNADDSQPEEWISLQNFVSRTSKVQLNHGFCPTCFEDAMAELGD